jgi:phosphatidylserine/phosphatidylglycerophosphate/cardiolipin synthase-like enzyme
MPSRQLRTGNPLPPAENLEHVDIALIDTARREIDLAAYVLTDWPVIQALTRAAERGVKGARLSWFCSKHPGHGLN